MRSHRRMFVLAMKLVLRTLHCCKSWAGLLWRFLMSGLGTPGNYVDSFLSGHWLCVGCVTWNDTIVVTLSLTFVMLYWKWILVHRKYKVWKPKTVNSKINHRLLLLHVGRRRMKKPLLWRIWKITLMNSFMHLWMSTRAALRRPSKRLNSLHIQR